ncbi:MAG: methyltransferase domain-containing protein [Syntrophorhabdaceae bacterium]|nr:methyltransferase domain-containing protein [Syntrophorhabdaceae bacterium]
MKLSSWEYDDMIQIGKDFMSREVVEGYDAKHRRFRDVMKENEAVIDMFGLREDHVVADIGCGTGAFVIQAARRCAKVFAIDISTAMLDYTRREAARQGITNIVYCTGGFLTYRHEGEPLDAISTSLTLHHLPDFWKQRALRRMNDILKDGGRLYLMDIVFSDEDYERNIPVWIEKLRSEVGPDMAEAVMGHIRKEHSTFTWIMEGLLERAGFRIDDRIISDGAVARYFCTKNVPVPRSNV